MLTSGVTHLSIGVIIYLEGLSVRHPKGARSIGIGHPRSGDRCTKTLPYPLDPLWVAEQSLQRPRQGVAGSLATPDPRVVGATPLDPGLKSGHPCRGASFTTLHNEWSGSCNAQMRHPWIRRPDGLEAGITGCGALRNGLGVSSRRWAVSITGIRFDYYRY